MTKLVVIVGPTASGKSALAMKLARKFNGEIIAADSRTVYRYMNIGTAKPTKAEMSQVPHHLVDIADPDETFTAADFKRQAEAAINDISARGKLPILVGGSGLYIDSILYDYQFPKANQTARKLNQTKSLEELVQLLQNLDPDTIESIDLNNRRRVERAIETAGMPKNKSNVLRPETLVLGITLNKDLIHKRIIQRVEKMLEEGLFNEVKFVGEKFGWHHEALTGPAYRAIKEAVLGTKTIDEAKDDFIRSDVQLAKKQMTWFKRNPHIKWLAGDDSNRLEAEATALVSNFLS